MNIGEISKPTVNRSQIKNKLNVKSSEPIVPSEKVSDLVELSEEARHKFEEEDDREQLSSNSGSIEKEDKSKTKENQSIDIKV